MPLGLRVAGIAVIRQPLQVLTPDQPSFDGKLAVVADRDVASGGSHVLRVIGDEGFELFLDFGELRFRLFQCVDQGVRFRILKGLRGCLPARFRPASFRSSSSCGTSTGCG